MFLCDITHPAHPHYQAPRARLREIDTASTRSENDTRDTLCKKIQAVEHELYSEVVKAVVFGKLAVQGRRVVAT